MMWTKEELEEMRLADAEIEEEFRETPEEIRMSRELDRESYLSRLDNRGRKIAEYHRAYYEANKDQIAEKNRAYRAANKDQIAEKKRAYYEKNKAARDDYHRAYVDKHREKINAYMREYYAKHREKINDQNRARRRKKLSS